MVLALFTFIAKGAVNIAFGVVMLAALLDLALNRSFRELAENRYFQALFLPLIAGLALSIFSDAGLSGPGFFFSRYRFFFLCLPFFLFIREKKHILYLFSCLSLSGVFSAAYGFVMAEVSNASTGFSGLLIVGRNSDLLASLCLMNTVLLFELYLKKRPFKPLATIWLILVLVICTAAILVIKQRAAMLGLFLGWLFYGIFFNRKFLLGFMVASLVGAFVLKDSDSLMNRIRSIGDRNETSNVARLDLLGSGIPYVLKNHMVTGAGEKNPEQSFIKFFKQQDKPFQEKYVKAMKLPGNFHNSFLQMAAEGGVLYLLLYLSGIGYVLFKMFLELSDPERRICRIGSMTVTLAGIVIFFFHGELYRYGGLVFYMALMSGCIRLIQPDPSPVVAEMEKITDKPAIYGSQGPIPPAASRSDR